MSQLQLDGGAVDNRDGTIDSLRRENRRLDEALRLARLDVAEAKSENDAVLKGVRELRRILGPLYHALQLVHGEIDAIPGTEDAGSTPVSHKTSAVWDAWKARLGKPCGQIIDALLLHRSMNQTQIAIATGITRGNISTYMSRLKSAGLTNKEGNEYSLKEL